MDRENLSPRYTSFPPAAFPRIQAHHVPVATLKDAEIEKKF